MLHWHRLPTWLLMAAASVLAACNALGGKPVSATAEGAPIALAPKESTSSSIAMPLDPDQTGKAVERLRNSRKKSEGPFLQAGADLNGDGKAEAVVLLTGPDWCSPKGCTLAVFTTGADGFRLVSQTIGVSAPVAVGPGSNAGWRDLIVKSAGKPVRLQFSGGAYPPSAEFRPDARADLDRAEILIRPEGETAGAAGQLSANP